MIWQDFLRSFQLLLDEGVKNCTWVWGKIYQNDLFINNFLSIFIPLLPKSDFIPFFLNTSLMDRRHPQQNGKMSNEKMQINNQIDKVQPVNSCGYVQVILIKYLHMRRTILLLAILLAASAIQIETYLNADPQQCIEEKCPTQWANCQKDSKCIPALQECEKKCGTKTSCWSLCLSTKGSQAAIDVAKCASANGCVGLVPSTAVAIATPQQCIEEKCPTQWAACQKDPKCGPALDDCEKKCGTKASCWSLCLPGKGSQAAIDVARCAQAQGCDKAKALATLAGPEDCIMKYCKKQEQACINDRRCINVLDECDDQCNTNFTCWNNCLARRGNKNASDYFKCIVDNKCYEAKEQKSTAVATFGDIQQCIQEKCPNQYAACQKDPKCLPALQDCQKKCGTKTSCWTFCLPGKGSQAAIDTAKCASANGCVGMIPSTEVAIANPQECIEQHCKDSLQACVKDPKCFPALQDCEKECGNNTSCYTTCLSKKGNANAVNFWKCILDNNCLNAVEVKSTAVAIFGDIQQCIEEKCPNQWAACQKDPKCLPALQDCQKKCGTKASCWTLCLPSKGSQAAIDTAKCAQAQGCVGMVPAFESCMMRSCAAEHKSCLANWACRKSVRQCRIEGEWNFDHECLFAQAKETGFFSEWYHCAGGHFCI